MTVPRAVETSEPLALEILPEILPLKVVPLSKFSVRVELSPTRILPVRV